MTLNIAVPEKDSLKPVITVFGVGGAGGNAVGNMIQSSLTGVQFVIANTDAQAMEENPCKNHIQLGMEITQGLGAGSYPEVGRASAEESTNEILDYLQGSNMVFITAGLGGGTGTGAAPVVAKLAREQGILTVGVVTKPFHFEGTHRMRVAELGLQELQKYVDTLIVIPNQNLFRVADKSTTFLDAFKLADDVLYSGVRGITDLMTMPGLINLDFSDVRSVMSEMGKAMMGTGEATGDNRAVDAAEAAIANPLLDNVSMQGARGVLINITGGADMTLFEVDEAAHRIREEVDPNANIIFGSTFDKELDGKIRVSVVATGIEGGAELAVQHDSIAPSFGAVAAASVPVASAAESVAMPAETASVDVDIAAAPVQSEPAASVAEAFIAPAPAEPQSVEQFDPLADRTQDVVTPDETRARATKSSGFFGFWSNKSNAEPAVEAPAASAETPAATPAAQEMVQMVDDIAASNNAPEAEPAIATETPLELNVQEPQPQIEISERADAPAATATSPSQDDLDIPAFLRKKTG